MASPAESPNRDAAATAGTQQNQVPFLTRAIASGLFSGYFPFASGTAGTAVGLAIYLIPGFEHPYVIIPACFLVLLLGIKAADAMEQLYGSDPAQVTIDEVLGMWVSVIFLPKSIVVAITAFLVFRVLDVVKPFPARKFDKTRGGFAVMFDDVISGTYTNLLMHLLLALNVFP